MKKLQNGVGFVFIISIVILTVISIFGIWKLLDGDVINKSFQTFGLLIIVSVIVMTAAKFLDSRKHLTVSSNGDVAEIPTELDINPVFSYIRRTTVVALVISVVLLALFGVLAIWKVLSSEVLNKSLGSITIVTFSSLMIILVCLEREHHKFMHTKMATSPGKIILYGILVIILLPIVAGVFVGLGHVLFGIN